MQTPAAPIRTAIVSRQEVLMRGLTAMLADYPDRVVITALPSVRSKVPGLDVILYDVFGLLHGDGSELDYLLHETDTRILLLSRDLRPDLRARAIAQGCSGWVSLSIRAEELVEAIERTMTGEPLPSQPNHLGGEAEGLSPRETEVLALVTLGLSNAEIATRLYLSANTLKTHIRSAYRKIGATNRSQAVAWAIQHGFAPPAASGL